MEVLNEPHVHHTDIQLVRNHVQGGQVWVDVFNADDSLHLERNPGRLTIADNRVETHERDHADMEFCVIRFSPSYNEWTGIHVESAKEVATRITGNTLAYVPLPASSSPAQTVRGLVETAQRTCSLWSPDERVPAAVRLGDLSDADVLVQGNQATGFQVGVLAASMDDKVHWRVLGNDFGTAKVLQYDDTVENRPGT